ncbi:MAG: nucleotidyltransferase domain-containing protein [Proteobacteria bacterium]|nr:nucleotidyltransferase domain-containing protein [Pseudomonadota bacterium]
MTESFGLGNATIEMIYKLFSNHPEVEKVLIFGSRAKGNQKVGSDIDLTMEGEISFALLSEITDELEQLPLPYQFDLSIYKNIENPDLLAHIERVGKVFYRKKV